MSQLLRRWLALAHLDLAPLRHREFRLLFLGRLLTFFGSMVSYTAVPYQVYQLTHSPLVVGALGLVELAALLALAFIGGALADAADRRLLVLLTELALMLTSAVLVVNSALSRPQVWVIFAAIALAAGLDALQRPSLTALVPRLVERDEMAAAGALEQLRGNLAMIVGPAVAGVLMAVAGLQITYGLDVATFLAGLVFLVAMRSVPPPADAERPSLQRVVEGIRYARRRPDLLGTYFLDMIAMLFGMPEALFPAIAQGYGGAQALGLLYAAPAVGSLVFSLVSGWTRHVHRHGLAIVIAGCVWGGGILAFGFARSLALALICLVVAGAADAMSGLFRGVIWNQSIPDSLRGRLASIELLSYSSGPTLGNFEAGVVASLTSVRFSVISGGALCIVGCLACALALPSFRAYDNRKSPGNSFA